MIKIAIIGGGPSGVSMCIELKNKLANSGQKVEILVFEKNAHVGHGLPYAEKEASHILNLPKQTMEPVSGETDQFVSWLDNNNLNPESSFPSRYLFGQYLEYRAINAQLEAEHQGITIRYLINNNVLELKQTPNGLFCVMGPRGNYDVHHVILCLGHMPSTSYKELIGHPGYIHSLAEHKQDKLFDANESVLILGSRLTAIDTALKLKQKKHKGKLTMISRSGLLPAVLGREVPTYSLKHITMDAINRIIKTKELRLQDLINLFTKELKESGAISHLDALPKSIQDISPLEWIENEIREAERGARLWQQILFALYPLTPQIWPMLHSQDRALFLQQYYSLFITYLAAFPLDNAYKIQELLASNQLEVQGGLNELKFENGQFEAHCQDGTIHRAPWVINSTGCSYDATTLPLLNGMLDDGLITKHPLGGIRVDKETMQVFNQEMKKNSSMYAVGEVTKGDCFLTTDLGCVTSQTKKIASILVSKISHSRATILNN